MDNRKLIYADDARRELLRADPKLAYCIDNVPAVDAVEVVRCENCKHWIEADNGSWQMIGRTDGTCKMLLDKHYAERYMTERDHFCSYGERICNG